MPSLASAIDTAKPKIRYANLLVFGLLFWLPRICYFRNNAEKPFSDMADFVNIGLRILHNFEFYHSPFWLSYKSPVLPMLLAGNFWLFGDNNYSVWPYFQSALLFLVLIFMCREIALAAGRQIYGYVAFLLVALAKPSIFWALKPAAESLGETFAYLLIALAFYCCRNPRPWVFAVTGVALSLSIQLKGQFIAVLPAFLLYFVLRQFFSRSFPARRLPLLLGSFVLGLALMHSPWLARSYKLYGDFVITNTSGVVGILWEAGPVTITLEDGSTVIRDINQLQGEAPTKFKHDLEWSNYAYKFANKWMADNMHNMPRIYLRHAETQLFTNNIALSTVSRDRLYGNWGDFLLFDKTPFLLLFGIIGLLAMALRHPLLLGPIAGMPLALLLFGFFFHSDPRLIEPSIPLLLFGNLFWIDLAYRLDWWRFGSTGRSGSVNP